jgi:trehalose 6-phosphate synthase/phosphatase
MDHISLKMESLQNSYARAARRLILLDYDGTLAPIQPTPQLAFPTEKITETLNKLSEDSSNDIVVISGRMQGVLEEWLGNIPVTLVAEHGAFYKKLHQPWESYFSAASHWKDRMRLSMKVLESQFNGSMIEEKRFSLTWHYRNVQPPLSDKELRQILSALRSIPNKIEFIVYEESCVIELRTVGIDKGRFAGLYVLNNGPYDFIMAIGDGRTDEDMFQVIGKENLSVKVGKANNSHARFYFDSQEEVIPFLNAVSSQTRNVI